MPQAKSTFRPGYLPDWTSPPLDEVALAVQFEALKNLMSVHYGRIREAFADQFSGKVEEKAPIEPSFETFGQLSPAQQFRLELLQGPIPLRRMWLLSEDQHELVQIQSDRFVQNWRKIEGVGDYPRFDQILPRFNDNFERFISLASELGLGIVAPNQCELSYFNNIPVHQDETYSDAFARVLGHRAIRMEKVRDNPAILVPETEAFNLTLIATSKEKAPLARVHVTALPATVRDNKSRVIRLTVIYRAPVKEVAELEEHFRIGRETIVRIFDSLLSDTAHSEFGRVIGDEH